MKVTWTEELGHQMIRLESEVLAIKILPDLGGKIVSIDHREKAFEAVLHNARGFYEIGGKEGDFGALDASGMDECFPSIDAADFTYDGMGRAFPDHGELWRYPMEIVEASKEQLVLRYVSEDNAYVYTRTIRLEGENLKNHYCIENTADHALPHVWTTHGLMRYEEDMEVVIPKGIETIQVTYDSPAHQKEGEVYTRPDPVHDMSKVPAKDSMVSLKWYGEQRVIEGFSALRYPTQGTEFQLHWNPEALPWFGVWISAGDFLGDYTVAMEPVSSYYDDVCIAMEKGTLQEIPAHSRWEFDVTMTLTAIR